MNILIVDDEHSTRRGIAVFLKTQGHEVIEAENGSDALTRLQSPLPDLIISDVKMPKMGGLELLRRMKENQIVIPVLMMTAFATVEDAVQALKLGADDFLTKPLNLDELKLRLQRMAGREAMKRENLHLKQKLHRYENPDMIGTSPAIERVREAIGRLSRDSDVPVVITGESGTGKELAARSVHRSSNRAEAPFVAVNCAAFQDTLLESELFGHIKGAFTGAFKDKTGIFQSAHRGSLFLDEVSEMSMPMQSKMLRVLQESVVQPVGSHLTHAVDVRIISASNRNLRQLVDEGLFREDLYYRLNVVEIRMPSLRERPGDIPLLIDHFMRRRRDEDPGLTFGDSLMRHLKQYVWPGNVRELENMIRMLAATAPLGEVGLDQLPEPIRLAPLPGEARREFTDSDFKRALSDTVSRFECGFLTHHLQLFQGNISKTAQAIGLSRAALHQKIKQYEIETQ